MNAKERARTAVAPGILGSTAYDAIAQVIEGDRIDIRVRIAIRLNDFLTEMKPDHDDSITGFNQAWDIVRNVFKELEA